MAEDSSVRKLTRSGSHSYYVLIPPEFVRSLNWRTHQKLVVTLRGKNVVISDWKPKRTPKRPS